MKKSILFLTIIALAIIAMATTSVRNARLVSSLSVAENLVTGTTSTYIDLNGLNEAVNYMNGSTRADADNVYAALLTGDGTIDLTSLTNSLGEALDLSDEVVVAIKFLMEDTSGATCTISQGASNPYPLFGSTYSIQLLANQSLLFKADTVLVPVDATHKTIDYDFSGETITMKIILITADSYQ